MQDGRKAVGSIPYISVAFFPISKQNFIAYCSSKVSSHQDCIFEIHELWQSGFSRVYFNCCCSCSFEAEIIKIGQSSYKMYSNNIVNFQKSTTILNAHTKNVWKLIVCTSYIYIYIYIQNRKLQYLYIKLPSIEASLYRRAAMETLVWFDLVLWHIKHCRLFNAKSSLWFGLVGFYGISIIIGYLMPNPLNAYILNIYDLVWLGFMAYQPL